MNNGRVLSRQFVEVVRMLLAGLPSMSSGDVQYLIALPGVEKRIMELIWSLLPERGPAYGVSCDGAKSWDDLLSEGYITLEGSLGRVEIIPHPEKEVIVRLLRRDSSSPVPLALAQHIIHSMDSLRVCNPEEMLSWIVQNWDSYLKQYQPIVFPDPNPVSGCDEFSLSLILKAGINGEPLLSVETNRKEWDPGTWFAVVVR